MKKLLLSFFLLTGYQLQAADSHALQADETDDVVTLQLFDDETDGEVTLQLFDGTIVTVPCTFANQLDTIHNLLHDLGDSGDPIPLPVSFITDETLTQLQHVAGLTTQAEVIAYLQQLSLLQLLSLYHTNNFLNLTQTFTSGNGQEKALDAMLLEKILEHLKVATIEKIDPHVFQTIDANSTLKQYIIEGFNKEKWIIRAILEGHKHEVTSVVFSPSGILVATASQDGTVKLWNVATGSCLHTLKGHTDEVTSVAFSDFGENLLTASKDRTIKIWDVATGSCQRILKDHQAQSVILNPNGRIFAEIQHGATSGTIWSIEENVPCKTTAQNRDRITSFAFNPNYPKFAIGCHNGTIKIQDERDSTFSTVLQAYSNTDKVSLVAFSPNGQLLATAAEIDPAIKIYNTARNECVLTLKSQYAVCSLSFNDKYRLLAIGSWGKSVEIFDTTTGERVHTLQGHTQRVTSVAFSPNGEHLVTASVNGTTILWSMTHHSADLKEMLTFPIKDALTFYKTGEKPQAQKLSVFSGLHTLEGHTRIVNSVAFSPDDKFIATASYDKTAKIWNTQTGKCVRTLAGHERPVNSVAFNRDGQLIATASYDRTVKLWNPKTGECVRTLAGHERPVNSVAFSPDGQLLATASDDGTVQLWNPKTGECVRTFKGHTYAVTSVVFSPDSQLIVTGSIDGTAKIWNTQTGECTATLQGHTKRVYSVAFSPDGRWLATASYDSTAKVWDAQTGECVRTFEGHIDEVSSVAFSPDGRWLATASYDSTAKLWEMATGECVGTLEGHIHRLTSVAFNHDGTLLVTASNNGTAKLWRINNFAEKGSPVSKIPAAQPKETTVQEEDSYAPAGPADPVKPVVKKPASGKYSSYENNDDDDDADDD